MNSEVQERYSRPPQRGRAIGAAFWTKGDLSAGGLCTEGGCYASAGDAWKPRGGKVTRSSTGKMLRFAWRWLTRPFSSSTLPPDTFRGKQASLRRGWGEVWARGVG